MHLEEDAGKLVHNDEDRISLADYNRCGIPLIGIVTEPDFHSADEVVAFFEKIKPLLLYAGICDCKMEQKVFGFFMGQANKALKGAASLKAIQEYIRKKLSE